MALRVQLVPQTAMFMLSGSLLLLPWPLSALALLETFPSTSGGVPWQLLTFKFKI